MKSGSRVTRAIQWAGLLVAALAAGCTTSADCGRYAATQTPRERLRQIETLNLKEAAVSSTQETATTPPAALETAMSLQEARADALRYNLDLKVDLIDPSISEQSVNQARAQFEPSLFADAQLAKQDTPALESTSPQSQTISADLGLTFPMTTGGTLSFETPGTRTRTPVEGPGTTEVFTTGFSATLSQPLLKGAGIRANTNAIRIACYQKQIVEAQTKLEVMRVIAQSDRVYWQLYAARKDLEVKRNDKDLAQAQLDRAQRRVKAGAAAEVEIIRAETGVAEKVEGIILAENTLRQKERDLKRTLNRPGLAIDSTTAVIPSTAPDTAHYSLDKSRLISAGLDNRMEMLEVELQIAQDASNIDFARNQTLPALALAYTYSVAGAGTTLAGSYDVLNSKRFEDHTVGLHLVVPLGNLAARSQLRQAIYTRVQRLATREQRRAQIRQEVLDALDNLETNWQRVVANHQRTALEVRNLAAEVRQFELGLRTSTDVLIAETNLADAQSAEIASIADYQVSQIDLAFATGTLLGEAKIEWAPIVPDVKSP